MTGAGGLLGVRPELLGAAVQRFVDTALADLEQLRPLPMALLESLGVLLAEDVVAPGPVPAFDVAAVDGYAVRSHDTLGDAQWADDPSKHQPDVRLHVIGDLTAASWEPATVSAGASYTVTVGTPLPVGADAVVPGEATDGGLANVRIARVPQPGDGIRRRGSTVQAGTVLAPAGTRVTAATIALLASAGVESVLVSPPPRVLVAATGDELVDPSRPGAGASVPGRVVDVDSLGLAAAAREAGAHAHRVGIVPDEDEALRLLVEDHAHRADLLVTTGGTGGGHTDVLRRLFGLDDVVHFETLPLEPPLVVGYGRVGPSRMPVLCLPGDPAGALLGFELVLRPMLRRLAGATTLYRASVLAELTSPLTSRPGVREFRPARVVRSAERGYTATPLPGGEAFLTGFATANALLAVPEAASDVPTGAELPVLLLEGGPE
ncbi:molybdopterin molybdotransferase MoeA [Cryptosporangium minutisporangium]|uniref:Molybdopterin molybdenumtransferase n=1 Tax=Cryptosporangium minutisporangium TaxID=113569 RepID=A0ABP6T3I8_9ACTN